MMGQNLESMEEAMQLFVKFAEEFSENDPVKLAEQYKKLLLDISTGSWAFCKEFQLWRVNNGV